MSGRVRALALLACAGWVSACGILDDPPLRPLPPPSAQSAEPSSSAPPPGEAPDASAPSHQTKS